MEGHLTKYLTLNELLALSSVSREYRAYWKSQVLLTDITLGEFLEQYLFIGKAPRYLYFVIQKEIDYWVLPEYTLKYFLIHNKHLWIGGLKRVCNNQKWVKRQDIERYAYSFHKLGMSLSDHVFFSKKPRIDDQCFHELNGSTDTIGEEHQCVI